MLSSSSELLNELCGRGKGVNQILTQAPIGDSLGKKVDPMLNSKIFVNVIQVLDYQINGD